MNCMIDVFTFIGYVAFLAGVGLAIVLFVEWIIDCIKDAKRTYQYKHRFDKPPKAECYCIDCLFYKGNGYCDYSTGCGDACFCWRAVPRKTDIKEES